MKLCFPAPTHGLAPWLLLLLCLLPHPIAVADDEAASLRRIGEQVQQSIVLIAITDAAGREVSVGTGFAVEQPGLIATNLHVIGEGRSFVVKDPSGKPLEVAEIVASDRFYDLAILRLKNSPLQPLRLAEFAQVQKGEPFVAIGHPQGLKDSIVQGIISAKRTIDGRPMLQVAMPVESGNSGGPVVNPAGEVVGVVTLKSLATDNIGFAIGSDQVKQLIERPNPVAFQQWLKIGVLRPDLWEPKFGASWRQKGGRILTYSPGDGFGGRSICLYQPELPPVPFEVEVEVKLDDESGAAGLAFLVDEDDRHYGFYPSNSRLRFSRFEGSTPYQWTVLDEQPSSHYKPQRWNRLKVRIEKGQVICFVNDEQVAAYRDRRIEGTKVGLAKFRDTRAEFRNFRVADRLPVPSIEPRTREQLLTDLDKDLDNQVFEAIRRTSQQAPVQSREMILDEVNELEEKIKRLKQLSSAVHLDHVKQNFAQVIDQKNDADIDLIEACLWIAKLDEPDLEIPGYRDYFDDLASELQAIAGGEAPAAPDRPEPPGPDDSPRDPSLHSELDRIAILNRFLFDKNGFHGSRHDYYRKENSYISSVLDDREGIPITLAVLYLELGRRLGLSMDGIGLPGHFLVSCNRDGEPPQLIDVFAGGQLISRQDAQFIVASTTTLNWDENYLRPVSRKQILIRVLNNLRGIAESQRDLEATGRYLELLFLLDPDDVSIKGTRALLLFQQGFQQKAIQELDQIIQQRPTGLDLRTLEAMRQRLQAQMEQETQE